MYYFFILRIAFLLFGTESLGNTVEVKEDVESDVSKFQETPRLLVLTQVENVVCKGTGDKLYGVCKMSKDCLLSGGTGIGSCANDYGVCCQISVRGAGSSKNVTVVKDKAVTLVSSGVAKSTSVFEFPKSTNTCQLRLDFGNTRLNNPSLDPIRYGDCSKEYVAISGSPIIKDKLVVCGDLSKQHMFLSYGATGEKITVIVKTINRGARFTITAVQLPCNSQDIAPSDCLQYFNSKKGQVRTFGFPYQLNSQYYRICTKGSGSEGNTLTWSECRAQGNAKQFFISGIQLPGVEVPGEEGNVLCSYDFIRFPDSPNQLKLCGGQFPRTTLPSDKGVLEVNLDHDEIGHSVVITNLPESLSCSSIVFPAHDCREVVTSGDKGCICTLQPIFPILITIHVLASETCPTITGFECTKTTMTMCGCQQLYNEADSLNTGFCLNFEYN